LGKLIYLVNLVCFSWTITDFQATEIYDFALKLASNGLPTMLSRSNYYQKCRLQYAELLSELGGFNKNTFDYCDEIARAIWDRVYQMEQSMLLELSDIAQR
jgi:hypothetical protein